MPTKYENNNYYWWKEKDDKVHESVFQFTKYIDSRQSYKSNENLKHMRLYGNYEVLGLQAYQYARTETSYNTQNRLTLNVVQSMIDTVQSKITKARPKPTFLTDGGDWSAQRKAKQLTKFMEGQFYATEFYDKAAQAFLDSCIFGTGAMKIYKQDNKIQCERVFIDEIMVDDTESYYAKPRQIHQRKFIHKDVLKEMFPDEKGYIDDIGASNGAFHDSSQDNDMVTVIESWHLPSGPEAKDGKHAISIENRTLWCEEYKKDYFPFVFFRWGVRPLGFWGQGLAEQLSGIQLEINKILKTIQVSMHLTSIPKVFVEASSKVITAHLNNKIGGVIKYVGTKPSYESVGAIPPELFSHLDRLYERGFEIAGISQLSAQSVKPAGIESGKALREYSDIESERFQNVSSRYEKAFMDAAKLYINIAKECYENDPDFKVNVKGKKFMETISWKDVDLEEDKYMMHVFPTSALSHHPSGRLQDIQELMQAGLIPPEFGRKLLDFPDLEAYTNRVDAPIDDIERAIELMIDKGEYQTPEPYQQLEAGIVMMQQAYLLYRTQNAPEERLELFRRWIEDANELIARANTPPMEEANQLEAPPVDPAEAEAALMPQQANADALAQEELMALQPEAGAVAVPEAAPQSDLLQV